MSDDVIYVVRKAPHENGGWTRAYHDFQSAKGDLFDAVEAEDGIIECEFSKHAQPKDVPTWVMRVVVGHGEFGGSIREVPIYNG